MDLAQRKRDLENARDRAAAQLHAILGQLQLVEELLAEENVRSASESTRIATLDA